MQVCNSPVTSYDILRTPTEIPKHVSFHVFFILFFVFVCFVFYLLFAWLVFAWFGQVGSDSPGNQEIALEAFSAPAPPLYVLL